MLFTNGGCLPRLTSRANQIAFIRLNCSLIISVSSASCFKHYISVLTMDRATSVEYASEEVGANPDEVSCDLQVVAVCLKSGLVGDNDVDLAKYLTGYKELHSFFVLLGGAFGFVASDVKAKIQILEELLNGPQGVNFVSVSSMMDYEMKEGLLTNKKYVSGSRTLLRLHRGLDFVQKFLAGIYTLEDNAAIGGICRQTYDQTLGNFHPWTIRKAAQVAMNFLPIKSTLLNKITKGNAAVALKTKEIMPEMLENMAIVYQRVDNLYTRNNLHDLK